MASQISAPFIDEMYEAARRKGALGGKLLGAGGGGYLLIYAPFEKKRGVIQALERLGGQMVDFDFELEGVRSWEVR